MKCENCNKDHEGTYGSGRFCSSKCARSFSTKDEKVKTKRVRCIICNEEVGVNKRVNSKVVRCSVCKERIKNSLQKPRILKSKVGVCLVCGNEFIKRDSATKTCSKVCSHYLMSKKASERVLLRGTNNWKTKQEEFSYKFVHNIRTDSKLEQAAIVYLIDIFKADKIEKYRNILNFWDQDYHKTFNPDFWVVKGSQVYIVEVKMKCSENSTHTYYTTIPYKKEALQKYCNEKGYIMIWLDFDYDNEFKKIYDKSIKGV